jgi:ParB family chromosome partitioning protein
MSRTPAPPPPGKRPALGRGLSALLPGAPAPAGPARGFVTVPIEEVSTDVAQPRRYWNLKALEELTASVKAKGILQPILVRRLPEGGYRVVAGERRCRAAREAGLAEVPVIVKDLSESDAFEVALIENIQREDLNPVEEAEAYHRLVEDHGLTQEALAQRVGKDRSTIANSLRLLRLPPEVREHLASGTLSTGHAKVLLGVDDAGEVLDLTQRIVARGLSVRDLERTVQRKKKEAEAPIEGPKAGQKLQSLAKRLGRKAKLPVELKVRQGGAGEVVVKFASEEQGIELLETLVQGLEA